MLDKDTKFNLPAAISLNRADMLIIKQETNSDLGTILAICDSSLPAHKHTKIVSLLQAMADNYFTKQNLTNPLSVFEEALHEFNNAFNIYFSEQISWTKKINLSAVLVLEQEMHFVNYGQNHLLLVKDHRWLDIIKKMDANGPLAGLHIFEQIYSGSINNFSRILLCNSSLFDYLNTEKIKKTIAVLPLKNIPSQIEQLSSSIVKNHTIAGGVIEISSTTQPITQTKPIYDSDKPSVGSIDHLLRASRQTAQLLKPQLLPDVKKLKNKLVSLFVSSNIPHQQKIKKFVFINKKSTGNIISKINRETKRTAKTGKKYLKNLYDNIKNIPETIKYSTQIQKNKFKSLPTSSKYLLLLAIILLIIFSANIFTLRGKRKAVEQNSYYQTAVSQINEQHDKAEAAIIYGDNQKARELLRSSINIIFNLPHNDEERELTYNKLTKVNEQLMAKANKIEKIGAPTSLINLRQFANDINPIALIKDKNKLVVLDKAQIININLKDQQINTTKLTEQGINEAEMLINLNGISIIYETNGDISRFDPTENSFAFTNSRLTAAGENIKAATTYNQRLYFADSAGEIWRMNPNGINFYPAIPWLKENIDLNGVTDLNVDGNIYLLYNDGKIIKLTAGKKQDFKLEQIEPALSGTTKIYTDTDIPYLYILNPNNKRLTIFDKEGRLIKQYMSENFTNLKDFAVDYKSDGEKSNLYLLTDSDIFQILITE